MFRNRTLVVGFLGLVLIAALLLGTLDYRGEAATSENAARVALAGTGMPAAKPAENGGTRLVALMEQSTLDLRNLKTTPGQQVIVELYVTAGRARVRVPDHWVVNTGGLPVLGSIAIEDQRSRTVTADAPPRLVLRGFVLAGKVEVTS